jgi:hypothetical protein
VPTIVDDVTIDVPGSNPTIVLNSATGNRGVHSLASSEEISFGGGVLQIATTAFFSVSPVLAGGTIQGGTVMESGGAELVLTGWGGTLDGVTVNGPLDLTGGSAIAEVVNGLTLNGTATLGYDARLYFDGTQTLGGTGTVVFQNLASSEPALISNANNMTLTIGPGITVRGGSNPGYAGQIGYNQGWGGGSNCSLVLQGTINADDTNGGVIGLRPTGTGSLTDTGIIAARGGNVTIFGQNSGATLTAAGTMIVGAGGVITVNGNYSPSATSEFSVEVGGTTQADVGKLIVNGTATLGGAFNTVAVNGFVAQCMNVEVLRATLTVGQFPSPSFIPPPAGHQSLAVYIDNSVRFAISPLSDWNRDGVLNSQDFFDYLGQFFQNNGDFNHDGVTNSQDLFDFLASFFAGC